MSPVTAGSIQDVLDRLLDWSVVDEDGSTPITGDRANVIRFAKATSFVARTDLIAVDDVRVQWFGWLQFEARRTPNQEAVLQGMWQAWREARRELERRRDFDARFPDLDAETRQLQFEENERRERMKLVKAELEAAEAEAEGSSGGS